MQYKNWNPDEAVRDYYSRIQNHEKHYETVDDLTWPYIKIVNVSPVKHIYIYRCSTQSFSRLVKRSC